MALDGGGGGGPVGISNSFTGTAETIDVYGDFAAAYSGGKGVADSETNLIDALTGNHILVMSWDSSYNPDSYSNIRFAFKLYLNDQLILSEFHYDNNIENGPHKQVIIPPYTKVRITAENVTDSNTHVCLTALTGRIYR